MTTLVSGVTVQPEVPDRSWAAQVLQADELRLAGSRVEPYGRAKLGLFSKILLWGMRIYVVLSFVLIAAQLYISLKH